MVDKRSILAALYDNKILEYTYGEHTLNCFEPSFEGV